MKQASLLKRSMASAFCLVGCCCLAADPQVQRVEPQGGQRGGSVEVTLRGPRTGLGPAELMFETPGVAVESMERKDDNTVLVRLAIDAGARLGPHPLRLRTESGLSNLVTFHVGAFPEAAEVEPNDTPDAAQQIELGAVINGVVKREDADCFKFKLAEGQRLGVEVEGLRLGRTFFDPTLTLLGPGGEEVARCDDGMATYQDPLLSCVAPAAGEYTLVLRETAYRGDDNCVYRLHVGDFARPLVALPPTGPAGKPVEVKLVGGVQGPQKAEVEAPQARAEGVGNAPLPSEAGGAPTGVAMRVCDLPTVVEIEPNNNSKTPTPAGGPSALCGVIGEPGDSDFFSFEMKKDQTYDLRVHARDVRSPLDSVLRVYDAKGKRLAGNDDDARNPDSYLRFKAPADGVYLAQIDDQLGAGGEAYVYSIEAAPPSPVAEIVIEEQRRYVATMIEVPQEGCTPAMLTVSRRDFGGELRLLLEGLPEGVEAEVFPLAADYNRVPVLFRAAKDAPLGGSYAEVRAELADGSRPIKSNFKQQTWFVRGQNNRPMWSHWSDRAAVAVTKRLPFRIRLEPPKAPLVRNGWKDLQVVAERDEGFDAAIAVRLLYNPPGLSSNRSRSIRQKETSAGVPVTANGNAPTKTWRVAVEGEANVGGRVMVATDFVELAVAAPPVVASKGPVQLAQGQTAVVGVDLSHDAPFEGVGTAKLQGLPPGCKAQPVEFKPGAERIEFTVEVAEDAKPGPHGNCFVEINLPEQGETIAYNIGWSDVRIDPAPRKKPTQNAQLSGNQGAKG
ncbi:putative subtilase-type serine protease precursor [Pirellulimonas nuda]|uniref:Putative subtilase-type serine protease n=1 Tax=Pirellulimonas nuda TaxID=2528009 RepID=A0A518DJ34_9BACT|nr:PPC domain-containing protein [Pirellulimonas nuda]QDU91497.1 putative subtilase-type serine protease precursor [Pirellulimonas nuda]